MAELIPLPSGYPALLEELKTRIHAAQLRAALTLNQETIQLYWSIGQDLSSRFAAEGWGTKVVDRLAKDLGTEFPGVEGFSLRNGDRGAMEQPTALRPRKRFENTFVLSNHASGDARGGTYCEFRYEQLVR